MPKVEERIYDQYAVYILRRMTYGITEDAKEFLEACIEALANDKPLHVRYARRLATLLRRVAAEKKGPWNVPLLRRTRKAADDHDKQDLIACRVDELKRNGIPKAYAQVDAEMKLTPGKAKRAYRKFKHKFEPPPPDPEADRIDRQIRARLGLEPPKPYER